MEEYRMNKMESDLSVVKEDVVKIREKIFNGFEKTVNEIYGEVVQMRKLQTKIDNLEREEFRLANCPLQKSAQKNLKREMYFVLAGFTIITSLVTIGTKFI